MRDGVEEAQVDGNVVVYVGAGPVRVPAAANGEGLLARTRALTAAETSEAERGVTMHAGLSFALADQYEF